MYVLSVHRADTLWNDVVNSTYLQHQLDSSCRLIGLIIICRRIIKRGGNSTPPTSIITIHNQQQQQQQQLIMSRISNTIEKQRSHDHLSQRSLLRSLLFSGSLFKTPSLSNMSDLSYDSTTYFNGSSGGSFTRASSSSSSSSRSSGSSSSNSSSTHQQQQRHNNYDTSSSHSSWIMNDDDRIDRFSENYYRFNWGLHKGGLVLVVFMGLIGVTSLVVGLMYVG